MRIQYFAVLLHRIDTEYSPLEQYFQFLLYHSLKCLFCSEGDSIKVLVRIRPHDPSLTESSHGSLAENICLQVSKSKFHFLAA